MLNISIRIQEFLFFIKIVLVVVKWVFQWDWELNLSSSAKLILTYIHFNLIYYSIFSPEFSSLFNISSVRKTSLLSNNLLRLAHSPYYNLVSESTNRNEILEVLPFFADNSMLPIPIIRFPFSSIDNLNSLSRFLSILYRSQSWRLFYLWLRWPVLWLTI